MSWKGPIFAQGLWPLERPARWTKVCFAQGNKEMPVNKVNWKRRKTSKGLTVRKECLKPAIRYPKHFWMKLLFGKRISKGGNKNTNSSNCDISTPGINSLMRKLSISEKSSIRKVKQKKKIKLGSQPNISTSILPVIILSGSHSMREILVDPDTYQDDQFADLLKALNESISTKEVVGEVVQVLATTLDTEDDEEGHLTTLNINAVMDIEPHGVGDAGFIQDEDIRGEVMDIVDGRAYHWKEWCLARGRNCLYIWSDAAALELSNRSNGWFRFILDDKLATMYSSGSPEGGRDSSENREEFLEKLQRARANVKPSAGSTELFKGGLSEATIVVGNWSLSCSSPTELNIVNSDGQQQSTKLKEDLPGFLFESHRGSKHYFTETSLGPEFSAGWTGKLHNGWIDDPWDLGGSNNYRLGAFGYEPESLTGAVAQTWI